MVGGFLVVIGFSPRPKMGKREKVPVKDHFCRIRGIIGGGPVHGPSGMGEFLIRLSSESVEVVVFSSSFSTPVGSMSHARPGVVHPAPRSLALSEPRTRASGRMSLSSCDDATAAADGMHRGLDVAAGREDGSHLKVRSLAQWTIGVSVC